MRFSRRRSADSRINRLFVVSYFPGPERLLLSPEDLRQYPEGTEVPKDYLQEPPGERLKMSKSGRRPERPVPHRSRPR
jgi:hypothetical protein